MNACPNGLGPAEVFDPEDVSISSESNRCTLGCRLLPIAEACLAAEELIVPYGDVLALPPPGAEDEDEDTPDMFL